MEQNGTRDGRVRGVLLFVLILGVALLWGCRPADPPGPPAAPTGVTASEGTFADRVRVTWEPVPDAQSYQLERADVQHGPYETLAITADTSYEDTDVTPGEFYWYRVRACSEAGLGCSSASNRVRGYAGEDDPGTPEPPDHSEELSASQGTHDDRIRVTWQPVPGATSYRLYRADEVVGPFEQPIATVVGTSYDDIDGVVNRLALCHSYWYRLQPCMPEGCMPLSAHAEGWRGTRIEGKVEGLTASDLDHPDRITLTWEPLPGAYEYTVYRGDEDNEIGTSRTTTYEDINGGDNPLEARTWYRYWVRAEPHPDGTCEPSELSSSVRGRASRLPGVPVDLSTSGHPERITLRWGEGNSIESSTHYVIDRALDPDGPYEEIAEVPHATLVYTDTDVVSGTTYWYRILAGNAWGMSDPSEAISSTVP